MNYRVLLIISLVIIVLGFGGLFMLPTNEGTTTENVGTTTTSEESSNSPVTEKVITTVTLNRDLEKGTLIKPEDYTLSELTVAETSPLVDSDLKALLDAEPNHSLQGFLVTENLKMGSLLTPNLIITPEDPRFILLSLDPSQEVAYRIYVQDAEQYILDSVRGGDLVSVYSVQQDLAHPEREQNSLVKIADNLKVLQVKSFTQEEVKQGESQNKKDFLGYISLKIDATMLKEFYSLDKQAKLIALPSGLEATEKPLNHRGMFIRQLRGKNNAN